MFFEKLQSRKNDGFTLVELIVVIAILAILAGIAVPAYSGYVEKANIAADQQLVAEVVNALTIQYYSDHENAVSDYVVVTADKAGAGSAFAAAAMENAFGEGWENSLRVSHDGWTDSSGFLGMVSNNPLAGSVSTAPLTTQIGTDKLLGDVQKCSSQLAKFLTGLGWKGEESAKALNALLGGEAGKVPSILEGYEGEITSDVLANATVFGIASGMTDEAVGKIQNNFNSGNYILRNWEGKAQAGVTDAPLGLDTYPETILTEMANTYAALEGLVGYLGDDKSQEIFDSIPLDGNAGQIIDGVRNACNNIVNNAFASPELTNKVLAYYDCSSFEDLGKSDSSLAMQDANAYCAIMQTVNDLDQDYVDSLTNKDLFTSDGMSNRVDDYIAASSLAGTLGQEGHDLLKEISGNGYSGSSVIVLLTIDGSTGEPNCTAIPKASDPRK